MIMTNPEDLKLIAEALGYEYLKYFTAALLQAAIKEARG